MPDLQQEDGRVVSLLRNRFPNPPRPGEYRLIGSGAMNPTYRRVTS